MKRLLLIKPSSLGDLFHAWPAVHSIRAGLSAELDWVVNAEFAALVAAFDDVSRVIPFPRKTFMSSAPAFFKELRKERYDIILDFQGLLKSALISGLARGALRLGPSFHREGACLFYNRIAGARNKNRHAVDECMDFVAELGVPVLNDRLSFRAEPLQKVIRHPAIGVLPHSRWRTKDWPATSYMEALRTLQSKTGAAVYLLGGAGDRATCETIKQALSGHVTNLAGETSLLQLLSVLREVDVLISGDSGPLHMAAAVGTPVVGIYGITDPVRTGPFGRHHAVLKARTDLPHEAFRRCTQSHLSVIAQIAPERVVEETLQLLRGQSTRKKSTVNFDMI